MSEYPCPRREVRSDGLRVVRCHDTMVPAESPPDRR
jgi:hypothetical protein